MAMVRGASSSQQGFWAESVQLLLAHDSKKGAEEVTDEGVAPLRRHIPVMEKALVGCSRQEQRVAFLLTDASKVLGFVNLLRQQLQQQLLVGCVSEQPWLLPALDVVVASPEQAFDCKRVFDSDSLKALLIDRDCRVDAPGFVASAHNFASFYAGFEALSTPISSRGRFPWFSPPRLVPASAAILHLIPNSSSAAWDSPGYISALSMFAWGVSKVAVQDWSDVPLLLPGIIRGALTCDRNSPPLLLAPKDKVDRMISLLHVCAEQLGLSKLRIGKMEGAQILVDCPAELTIPCYLERLVVIEADTLLSSPSAWKIQRLVGICRNCSVAIHFSSRTSSVDQLLKANPHDSFCVIRQPKVTMQGVCEFFTLVESECQKLSRVCHIWKQLESSRRMMAIFCNSSNTVQWLVGEMQRMGIPAVPFCAGSEAEAEVELYRHAFPVVVTNVYRQGGFDVINYDLPDSYEEYMERVGRNRSDGRVAKVVINIGTSAQLRPFPPMVELTRDCSQLFKTLHRHFPDLFS